MKKQFFTFLMMIALVIVAGSAMAANTKYTPYIGSKFNYTVSSTNTGDAVNFYVTLATVDNPEASNEAVGIASAVITDGDGSFAYKNHTSTGADIIIEVDWKAMPSSGSTYRLWVQAKDPGASGCSNWRHMIITPLDYVVDFVVTTYGMDASFNSGTPLTLGTTGTEVCWPLLTNNEVTESTPSLTETTTAKLYFTVTRQAYNNPTTSPAVDPAITNDWEFTPSITGLAALETATTKFGYSIANVEVNTYGSGKVEPKIADGNVVYFSIEIPLNQITDRTIALNIASALDVNGKADDNGTTGSTLDAANAASSVVGRLPQIGTFN